MPVPVHTLHHGKGQTLVGWNRLMWQGWAVWTQLLPETLYLTCSIIDRFLEKKRVSRRNLQLVCMPPC